MSLIIESIKLINNQLINIDLHNKRFNRSRYELFGITKNEDLSQIIKIQKEYENIQRIRVTYNKNIENIEIIPYTRKKIESLFLVNDNIIDYSYKYADRSMLTKHLKNENSDILIIKNGFVTDTTISNVAFFDNKHWYTPETFLLKGIMREFLIQSGQLKEMPITLRDLKKFSKVRLINAFNGFDNPFEFDIDIIAGY